MSYREARIAAERSKRSIDQVRKQSKLEEAKSLQKIKRLRTITEERADSLIPAVMEIVAKAKIAQNVAFTALEEEVIEKALRIDAKCDDQERMLTEAIAKIDDGERKKNNEIARLEKQLKAAETKATRHAPQPLAEVTVSADPRASTLAIFDSIVFAMSNWSNEGDTAPDFELACQSVLFPTIYERVMKGEDDYYIEEVPVSALEVVKRGREYIKMLRDTAQASLVDPEVWENYAPMVQEWWVNDALPLLYGARSDEWDADTPFSLLEVQAWKSQPASRALRFPLLFDGMELVEKNRDQIRETTGLPEFNKQTLQTRINP